MFTLITCPACQHKHTVPEGAMGTRRICPNCQSPFVAGASVPEARGPQRGTPASPVLGAPASYGQTMLADQEQPIKYNCPRCKKPLESPPSEGGTKKPCPACGQRLQVPAAPPPPAPAPAPAAQLNRTMLADTEPPIRYNCPNCKKPLEAPASEGGIKKPCPACGQRLQVPAAPRGAAPQPNLNRTMLAGDENRAQSFTPHPGQQASYPGAPAAAPPAQAGMTIPGLGSASPAVRLATIGAVCLFLLLLLGCVIPAVINGGREVDKAALARAEQELERLRGEMSQYKTLMEKQQQFAEEQRRGWEKMLAEQRERQDKLEAQRRLDQLISDRRAREDAEAKREQEQRDIERLKREAEEKRQRESAETQAKLDALQKKLEEANTKTQTIVTQPAPVVVHPPWSPYYYRPWWAW